jgi:hypothetical protein
MVNESVAHRMVTSAVLGAAAGTGLALVVAMTIVVYRYYALRRRGKDWSQLERFGDTSLLGADWSGLRKSKPHQTIYTVTQKVSAVSVTLIASSV